MHKNKIGTIESILLVLSSLAPLTVISLPRTMINETKSSILLNIIFVSILCLLISFLIYKLFKNFPSLDIIDTSSFLGGPILKNIIGFIFIFYFILTSSILLRNFCEGLEVVYYQYTNVIFIVLFFVIAIAITNHLGFNSTIRTTTLTFPFILISIVLLFFGNIGHFSFERIFPILGFGFYNTFVTGLVNIGCFSGIVYLYFLPPLLKNPEDFKMISIASSLFSGLFIFICMATILFMFSLFVETSEIMPLFIVSRYIEFGTFFQRFESLFLLIWIIAFCCYLSIICKFSTYIFAKIFNIKDSTQISYSFIFLIFGFAMLPKNYAISYIFETYIFRYLSIAVILLGLLILSLANIKKKVGG